MCERNCEQQRLYLRGTVRVMYVCEGLRGTICVCEGLCVRALIGTVFVRPSVGETERDYVSRGIWMCKETCV